MTDPLPPGEPGRCPACGGGDVRPLTRKEWRDLCGGEDRLVVVMPRTCRECGRVWDPIPSRAACYAVAAVALAGWLAGSAVVVGVVVLLVAAAAGEGGGANTLKNRLAAAGFGLLGLGVATWSYHAGRKYYRLARRSPRPGPPGGVP